MSKINGFPKIFPVGSDYIPSLFDNEVEITEKIDGSQFGFGINPDGDLVFRSKGKQMYFETYEKMFKGAADYLHDNIGLITEALPRDTYIYGEYLEKPKHNILAYQRIPRNHIMVFGVRRGENFIKDYGELTYWANLVDLECVPLLHRGKILSLVDLNKFMELESVLGGEKLEGVVVKNYTAQCIIGNIVMPSFGKAVRTSFKERHAADWSPHARKIDILVASFRTEARWEKAVQHLRDNGQLVNDPKDIGPLLKHIHQDLEAEDKLTIMKELYDLYILDIKRKACAGFPEWYKQRLTARAFEVTAA